MKVVVFSGGTATNSLTPCFNELSINQGEDSTYVLPISDNGGSTSEILRVLGGPAVGDIRSRIVRLIEDPALTKLFGYRSPQDTQAAKDEWNKIVEGTHIIWKNIPVESRDMARPFLINVQSELLKKSKNSNPFHFGKASIGNFFLTGVRLFLGSVDASIELMMRIGRANTHLNVIPCINTNHTHHISALLTNGEVITGQSQISHPSKPQEPQDKVEAKKNNENISEETLSSNRGSSVSITKDKFVQLLENNDESSSLNQDTTDSVEESGNTWTDINDTEEEEFANPIYILPALKESQINFDKMDDCTLPAPIKRILYINPYGEEIRPVGNPRAVAEIKQADMSVYSIGSLMTSLLPIIILGNIADVISETKSMKKVLLINNKYDRETFFSSGISYIKMVVDSMRRAIEVYRTSKDPSKTERKSIHINWNDSITDVVYLSEGEIKFNEDQLNMKGIRCHEVKGKQMENEISTNILQKIHKL